MLSFYFSGNGRTHRKAYSLYGVIPIVLLSQLLLVFLCSLPYIRAPSDQAAASTFMLIVLGFAVVSFALSLALYSALAFITAKRAHDAGLAGHWGGRLFVILIAYFVTNLAVAFGFTALTVAANLCSLVIILMLIAFALIPGDESANDSRSASWSLR